MTRGYGVRHWALVSSTYGEGKSTFIAANAMPPVHCIDTDGRFDAVAGLVDGTVLYPTRAGRGIGPTGAIALMNEAQAAVFEKGVETIVVDSVTKLYSFYARIASVAGKLSDKQRKEMGFSTQKAADMVGKSNIMTIIATLPAFGTDVYYTWHRRKSIDVKGKTFKSIERDRISDTEIETIMASVNVKLSFFREGRQFGVTVDYCRDRNGRKANTGFTIYDAPGNYWKGGADRLERLMYTSFPSVDDAVKWGMERLGNDDPGEIGSLYEFVKSEQRPKTQSQMAVAWIKHIDELVANCTKAPIKQPPQPQKEPIKQDKPEPPPMPKEELPFQPPPLAPDEPLFPEDEPVIQPEPEAAEKLYYDDGSEVGAIDLHDVVKYRGKFNKLPPDYATLKRAIKGAKKW